MISITSMPAPWIVRMADSRARARPLDIYLHLAQTHIVRYFRAVGRCGLGCVGSIFLRTSESHLTGRAPADDLSLSVGQRDDHVVESRVHVSHALSLHLDNLLLNCSSLFCHNSLRLLSCFFLVGHSFLPTFAGTALFFVLCPRTGSPKRWRMPR